jgi:hypothetical protein
MIELRRLGTAECSQLHKRTPFSLRLGYPLAFQPTFVPFGRLRYQVLGAVPGAVCHLPAPVVALHAKPPQGLGDGREVCSTKSITAVIRACDPGVSACKFQIRLM